MNRLAVLTLLMPACGSVEDTGTSMEDTGTVPVCTEDFDEEPEIVHMEASFQTISWDGEERRLAWVTRTGGTTEPYATAMAAPAADASTLEFSFAITSMGATGNHNKTFIAWTDPSTEWRDDYCGSPSRGVGVEVGKAPHETPTSGALCTVVGVVEDTIWVTSDLTATWYHVSLTYDVATGDCTVLIVDADSATILVDDTGTMEAGLSLTILSVSGGLAEATAAVVDDRGWIDDVVVTGGECGG